MKLLPLPDRAGDFCVKGAFMSQLSQEIGSFVPYTEAEAAAKAELLSLIGQYGDQILLGGNSQYISLCRKHWAIGDPGTFRDLHLSD